MGLARTGSIASTTSGDLFLAFATGNRGVPAPEAEPPPLTLDVRMVLDAALNPVFEATIEATEEAIYNSLFKATDVRDIKALPLEKVLPMLH